ncbi:uncharacterized protein LOC113294103 [Papaver somniferum]|uniref:uncharacterized protein LOC113294103 n=1 Tax=Papaver somniferum TaxID=3469 RepID=UPI000E700DDB|nr:uncharacterized protein LOC113294103 [Papaver somniferum]
MDDKQILQEHIVEYYNTLFTEEEVIRPDLENITFDKINSQESYILEADFIEEEVMNDIQELGNNKAPGPDGFPIIFFSKGWSFLKDDIMNTVNEFCSTYKIYSKHNSTFITLVPKKDYIEKIQDCSPICLLTSVYKIIAKVLASRLKLVMDKLIFSVQCAYIEGRQIIDGTLIANELVHSRLRSGKAGIICKIDLEKSFEMINWKYLEFILHQMGFGRKLCKRLKFCYSISTFSVLINGSSFGYFTSSRGVRQGCPVSPLLFNIAMEGFSRYMDRASQLSLFSGFSVTSSSIIVNHLHFADDTIFFVDNSKQELHNLFSALKCFEYIGGLKVNTSKTRLIAIGDVPELSVWASEFGCATDNLPFLYLGISLGAKETSKHIWDPIIEKFDVRLSTWRNISLSKGEQKMRNFLWDHGAHSKVSHLINWNLVCVVKEKGGLGVCNLRLMNLAMLAKWCWRFGKEKNRLWYKIIRDKYGDTFSCWVPQKVNSSHGVSCWKTIAKTANLVSLKSVLNIHSGKDISFWNDVWCGDISLDAMFPSLFKISDNKNIKLAEVISSERNWCFNFKRNLTESEVNLFANLMLWIGDEPPVLDALQDNRRWTLDNSGLFSVKTIYAKLLEDSGIADFPYQFIWKESVPSKINFLVWCIVHEKLNTIDKLQAKGVDINNSCILCGDDTESHDHIFLHCKIAHKLWFATIPSSLWSWVLPRSFSMLEIGWHHTNFSNTGNYIWSLIPSTVVFTLWTERNRRTFEQNHVYKTDLDLEVEVKSLILSWANAAGRRLHINYAFSVMANWEALFV